MKSPGRACATGFLCIVHLVCATVINAAVEVAEDIPVPVEGEAQAESSGWEYILAFPMLWAPSINANIEGDFSPVEVEIPFSDIFSSLAFGFIGEFNAQKGRWSGAIKVNFLTTKDDRVTDGLDGPIFGVTIAPSHRVETMLSMSANDLQVQYHVDQLLSFYTGVRHFFTRMSLEIIPLGSGIIEIEEQLTISDDHLLDWIVGVTLRQKLSERWAIGLNADTMVAGQNDVDFLVNGLVFLRINNLNNIWLGYRYLQIGTNGDDLAGTFDTRFTQHGPTLDWAFTF